MIAEIQVEHDHVEIHDLEGHEPGGQVADDEGEGHNKQHGCRADVGQKVLLQEATPTDSASKTL